MRLLGAMHPALALLLSSSLLLLAPASALRALVAAAPRRAALDRCCRARPAVAQVNSTFGDETCSLDERCIYFVSGNLVKSKEVDAILAALDLRPFRITHIDIDLPELQGDCVSIAKAKAATAARRVGGAVVVEDTSLCFGALNGMPGPYIKSFYDAVGCEGLWQLVEHQPDKSASCECVLAFSAGPGAEPVLFQGRTEGTAVRPQSGASGGFGWDALFVPEGHGVPFSEMPMEDKNGISHRGRALADFVAYCRAHQEEVIAAIERHGAEEIDREHDGDGLVWGVEKALGRRNIV